MSFQIYLSTPSDGIVLPNPRLGDVRRLETGAINRDTRGGEHKAYHSSDWGTIETHVYEWPLLTGTEKDDLETFFAANGGKQVHIVDHNGDDWDGVFTTDTLDIRVLDRDDCSYSASLEFIGAATP